MIVTVNVAAPVADEKFAVSRAGLQYAVEEGDAFIFVDAEPGQNGRYTGIELRMPLDEAITEITTLLDFLHLMKQQGKG